MDEDTFVQVQQPQEPTVWTPQPGPGEPCLDLCFVSPAGFLNRAGLNVKDRYWTAQGATQNIKTMCDEIVKSEKLSSPACLRLALVAYRDHPPQDNTYVTKVFDFSSDVEVIKAALESLYASGGGDGPEAVTAALHAASVLPWRETATKMVVLIADAPPHGIGEYGDGFAEGSPDGHDPLNLVREMKSRGITLFMVACEPALSGYTYSTSFFMGLCQISSGAMVPLTNAAFLAHVIVGSALEQMNLERLIAEVGAAVVERLSTGQHTVDDVARDLHASLSLRNENTKHLVVENIYRDSPELQHNVSVWVNSGTVGDARPHLKKSTVSRFTDAYNARRTSSYSYAYRPYRPPVPPRPAAEPATTAPSSPPRTVVSSFKPFSASGTSIADTALGGTSAGFKGPSSPPSAFGASGSAFGLRSPASPGRTSEVADTQVEDALSGVELKLAGISFEQAKKIVDHSMWRARS